MAATGIFSMKSQVSPKTEALIKRLVKAGKSFKSPLRKAGLQLSSSMMQNFIAGGRPKKWAGLKLSTMLQRGAQPGGSGTPQVLRDTGILMNSIGHAIKDPQGVFKLQPYQVAVGTNVPYAEYHQEGTRRMVAREIILSQPRDAIIIAGFITDYVMEGA